MAAFLRNFLLSLCGLILALPQGWCCWSTCCGKTPVVEQDAPASCCCCPLPTAGDAENEPRAPVAPASSCQCFLRDTAPGKATADSLPDLLPQALLPFMPRATSLRAAPARAAVAPAGAEAPPLHVLICVWRC